MFAQNCWYVAGWEQDFTAGRLYAVRIADEAIVVYRKSDGAPVALEDRCRHRFAPLSLGCLEGDDLRCMYHGLKYDSSGRCIEIPGQDRIPDIARVRSYPAIARHSWVWVWIGDAHRADPALIPPAVGYDDGRYCLRHGQLDYVAPCHLINDNLLDFSHLSYVHRASFGAGQEFAYERPIIARLPRGVRISRWLTDRPSPRYSSDRNAPPSDHYSTYDFLVPGILLMYSGNFPAGTARMQDRGEPDYAEALTATFTSQAVTPITADTSRYFFSWGPTRSADADAIADGMLKIALQAFNEDKVMIEAQHRT
ncbi:MAG: Rieske 2Fe-2S domain-containing protein, partial [Steroidobacteraceae bacterium]